MIKVVNGKRFNVIPLYKAEKAKESKYGPKEDSDKIKARRVKRK